MIKLPKQIAFLLFVAMTILLAISFSNFNWEIFETNNSAKGIYKEIREPLMFLVLAIFFIQYYVKRLKEDND